MGLSEPHPAEVELSSPTTQQALLQQQHRDRKQLNSLTVATVQLDFG